MRFHNILQHPVYRERVQELERLEQSRIYCRHNQDHFLDVARLTYIFALEAGCRLSGQIASGCGQKEPEYTRDMIYAAAFLHDIGRGAEYMSGIPHEEAGAEIAAGILPGCGYDMEETEFIVASILAHRKEAVRMDSFSEMLYRADKQSRKCYMCRAVESCRWNKEKMNLQIRI